MKISMTRSRVQQLSVLCAALLTLPHPVRSADSKNPFIGHWALTIPGGGAGWLGVSEDQGKLSASILWGGGSVLPVDEVRVSEDALVLSRHSRTRRRGSSETIVTTETITAKRDRDRLLLTTVKSRPNQAEFGRAEFTGKQTPPLPPAPDLSKVRYGNPVRLLNGKDLEGWRLINPNSVNGWEVKDGVLRNHPVQEEGKPHINYGNLRTEKEFEDFNLTAEVNVAPNGNSGIYLRGIYEVQIADTFGKGVNPHNMGGIYSRITPTEAAEKPAGQWQTLDITLVDRHATVILNGKRIIDNQPVFGCTGGALWSDPFRPGPIYLQGDHTEASYRNLALRPVVR